MEIRRFIEGREVRENFGVGGWVLGVGCRVLMVLLEGGNALVAPVNGEGFAVGEGVGAIAQINPRLQLIGLKDTTHHHIN